MKNENIVQIKSYAKLYIAYKEARESHYWIRLLTDTDYLTTKQSTSLLTDIDELLKIIGSILKTIKEKEKIINHT
ncbi:MULTISPECIES: four helix bundle protein [Myroides]|uniref:four helix bundle protein n=1 Tax=Myroides TaxID=76831 RepID=UPI0002E0B11E|nr:MULTISPECIES: four helix bundle protein [Myroides]MCS7473370.1 four helix bundle protein [Myroides odoratimimus]